MEGKKKRSTTNKRHKKVIQEFDLMVEEYNSLKEDKPLARHLSVSFFYNEVADKLGYEFETVRRIITNHKRSLKTKTETSEETK